MTTPSERKKGGKEKRPMIRVGWTLPDDLVKRLQHLAVERRVRISAVIQEALERYLRDVGKVS